MAIFMTSMSHCLTSCLSIIILVAIAALSVLARWSLATDPGRSPDSSVPTAELALELELEQHTRLLKERAGAGVVVVLKPWGGRGSGFINTSSNVHGGAFPFAGH